MPPRPKFLLGAPKDRMLLGKKGDTIYVEHQGPTMHEGRERHTFLITHNKPVDGGAKTEEVQSRFHLSPKTIAPGFLEVALEPDNRDVVKGNPNLPALQALPAFMGRYGFEIAPSVEPEVRKDGQLVYHYKKVV